MAHRIDVYLEELGLEQQFIDAMRAQHITGAELARRNEEQTRVYLTRSGKWS
jgi:hypothetical protein